MMREKPRIGIFFSRLAFGGIGRVYTELAPFLSPNYDLDFILVDGSRVDYPELGNFSGNIDFLISDGEFRWYKLSKLFLVLKRFYRIAKSRNHAVIIASQQLPVLICVIFSKLLRYKMLLTAHTDYTADGIRGWSGHEFLVRKQIAKYCFSQATGIICVSSGISSDLINNYAVPVEKCRVIHNPAVIDRIRENAREQMNDADAAWFSGEGFHYISAGRLTAAKNFRLLLSAFGEVRKSNKKAKLTILGEGEERDGLEACIRENGLADFVRLPGFKRNVFKYLAKADCFVSSSDWEGFGNVIVEAMACGIPVIATSCSGPLDILRDQKDRRFGIIVPTGDQMALAGEMLEMANNRDHWKEYAGLAFERASVFDGKSISGQYVQLIEETIGNDG